MDILYTETINKGANLLEFLVFSALVFIVVFAPILTDKNVDKTMCIIGICLASITSISLGWVCGYAPWCATKTYNQYTVTIDESVSLVEFLDKYELIEQKDELYIIRELEPNE